MAEQQSGPSTPGALPRIAIVDDHPLVRQGLADLLAAQLPVQIIHASGDLQAVSGIAPAPDLLVLDLDLGGRTADPMLVAELMARGTLVLVISALASPTAVRDMVRIGVAGFVSKAEPPAVLVEAVAAVLAEGIWTSPQVAAAIAGDPAGPSLSPQEQRVLVLYASGLKLESVARRAGITAGTAKTYLKRIRAKYAQVGRPVPTKTDLYREAVRDGLMPAVPPGAAPPAS